MEKSTFPTLALWSILGFIKVDWKQIILYWKGLHKRKKTIYINDLEVWIDYNSSEFADNENLKGIGKNPDKLQRDKDKLSQDRWKTIFKKYIIHALKLNSW